VDALFYSEVRNPYQAAGLHVSHRRPRSLTSRSPSPAAAYSVAMISAGPVVDYVRPSMPTFFCAQLLQTRIPSSRDSSPLCFVLAALWPTALVLVRLCFPFAQLFSNRRRRPALHRPCLGRDSLVSGALCPSCCDLVLVRLHERERA
jgi:hypothetical protein